MASARRTRGRDGRLRRRRAGGDLLQEAHQDRASLLHYLGLDGLADAFTAGEVAMCANWHEFAAGEEKVFPGKVGYAFSRRARRAGRTTSAARASGSM